jgi:hypothetical protein
MSERPGCESLRAYQFDWSSHMSELKRHVMGEVHFEFYRDGNLWYRSDSGLSFPVPIDDIGTATFKRDDKGCSSCATSANSSRCARRRGRRTRIPGV